MSGVMFRRALAELRWTTLWYALGLALFAVLAVALWPSVRRDTEQFAQLLDQIPEALRRALGVGDVITFTGYLGARLLNFFWPLVASVFAIMAGAAVVAQEVERGTVELWLSVPLPRRRLLAAKLAALLAALLALALSTVATLALMAPLVDESLTVGGLLAAGVMLAAFGAAVGGVAALFSAVASERGRAAGGAVAVTLASYVLWVLAGLSDRWSWLQFLSFYTAFTPQQALERGRLPLPEALVLVAIAATTAAGALALFERRSMT
jgi:ABC-2 type transport system permease protein